MNQVRAGKNRGETFTLTYEVTRLLVPSVTPATAGVKWHEIGQVENAANAGWTRAVSWPLDLEEDRYQGDAEEDARKHTASSYRPSTYIFGTALTTPRRSRFGPYSQSGVNTPVISRPLTQHEDPYTTPRPNVPSVTAWRTAAFAHSQVPGRPLRTCPALRPRRDLRSQATTGPAV